MKSKELKFTLFGFPDKEMEKQFILSTHNPKEIRILILMGLAFYTHFLYLDSILFRDYYSSFLLIRCGVFAPVILILLALSYTHYYEKLAYYYLAIVEVVGSAGIIAMNYLVRESRYPSAYFYGLMIALLFFYGTGKATVLLSSIVSIVILIPAIWVEAAYVDADMNVVIIKGVLLFLMIIAGVFTAGIIQFNSRNNFLKQRKIEELSMTDFLTGLKNRLYFDCIMKEELRDFIKECEESQVSSDRRTSDKKPNDRYGLMLLDIDYFKKINDKYGHEIGDLFLQEFSERIKKIIRSEDVFIRWGGEEFLLLLRHTYDNAIRNLTDRIKKEISGKDFNLKTSVISASVSGGVISIPPKSEKTFQTIEHMIDLADQALYKSKHNGRNRFTECFVQKDSSDEINYNMRPITE